MNGKPKQTDQEDQEATLDRRVRERVNRTGESYRSALAAIMHEDKTRAEIQRSRASTNPEDKLNAQVLAETLRTGEGFAQALVRLQSGRALSERDAKFAEPADAEERFIAKVFARMRRTGEALGVARTVVEREEREAKERQQSEASTRKPLPCVRTRMFHTGEDWNTAFQRTLAENGRPPLDQVSFSESCELAPPRFFDRYGRAPSDTRPSDCRCLAD